MTPAWENYIDSIRSEAQHTVEAHVGSHSPLHIRQHVWGAFKGNDARDILRRELSLTNVLKNAEGFSGLDDDAAAEHAVRVARKLRPARDDVGDRRLAAAVVLSWLGLRETPGGSKVNLTHVTAIVVVATIAAVLLILAGRAKRASSPVFEVIRRHAKAGSTWARDVIERFPPSSLATANDFRNALSTLHLLDGGNDAVVEALIRDGGGVFEAIVPTVGGRFDAAVMEDVESPPVRGEHDKSVHEVRRQGVRVLGADEALFPAQVHCVTDEYRALRDDANPISKAIVANEAPHLPAGGDDVRRGWRLEDGLESAHVLVEQFGADAVDAWCHQVVSVAWSSLREKRGLGAAAALGDRFTADLMRTATGEMPRETSIVCNVDSPGLAAKGGLAIIPARVTLTSAFSTGGST